MRLNQGDPDNRLMAVALCISNEITSDHGRTHDQESNWEAKTHMKDNLGVHKHCYNRGSDILRSSRGTLK